MWLGSSHLTQDPPEDFDIQHLLCTSIKPLKCLHRRAYICGWSSAHENCPAPQTGMRQLTATLLGRGGSALLRCWQISPLKKKEKKKRKNWFIMFFKRDFSLVIVHFKIKHKLFLLLEYSALWDDACRLILLCWIINTCTREYWVLGNTRGFTIAYTE